MTTKELIKKSCFHIKKERIKKIFSYFVKKEQFLLIKIKIIVILKM